MCFVLLLLLLNEILFICLYLQSPPEVSHGTINFTMRLCAHTIISIACGTSLWHDSTEIKKKNERDKKKEMIEKDKRFLVGLVMMERRNFNKKKKHFA